MDYNNNNNRRKLLCLRTVELVSDLATLEYIDEVRYGGL